jgi:chemotaxis protein MotB
MRKPASLFIGGVLFLAAGLTGCVSSGTHNQTLAELEEARRTAAVQAQGDETAKNQLYNELVNAQEKEKQLQEQFRQANETSEKIRLDRDELKIKGDDLARKLETAKQDLAHRAEVLEDMVSRNGALTQKERGLNQTLSSTRSELREVTGRLDAELHEAGKEFGAN